MPRLVEYGGKSGGRAANHTHSSWRWLMATALPCADPTSMMEVTSFITNYASARMHVRANLFDVSSAKASQKGRAAACTAQLQGAAPANSLVVVSTVPGHKTQFWRRELTPTAVARYDIIWLLDCDVRVSPRLFILREIEYWMHATGASIVQPSVVPAKAGGRGGRGSFTRASLSADCAAREHPFIEQMTPVFRRGAFIALYHSLMSIPNELLGSDSGIDLFWCGLAAMAFPAYPACVVINTQSVIHTNTHTIHRFDKVRVPSSPPTCHL